MSRSNPSVEQFLQGAAGTTAAALVKVLRRYRLAITVYFAAALLALASAVIRAQSATEPVADRAADATPSDRVHIFYYVWYGNPAFDGAYVHWQQGGHVPPQDLGSSFYPALGAYSSGDPMVLRQHMTWIRQSGAGVLTLSWWGDGSPEDKRTPAVLDAAAAAGLKVNFHVEPWNGSDPQAVAQDIRYLLERYGRHPAFYRDKHDGDRPMFYIFNALRHPAAAWAAALAPLRKESEAPLVIAQTSDLRFVKAGGFDGGYTYDTLAAFKDAHFVDQWKSLNEQFTAAGKLFIPSVGPGYCDKRAVPGGNAEEPPAARTRDDGQGTTYQNLWQAAINARAPIISITSFNEWHEGTQIEPAVPRPPTYPGYRGGDDQFLRCTAAFVCDFQRSAIGFR